MNKRKWNSLSKQDQDIITRVTKEMMPDLLCQTVTNTMEMVKEKSKKLGHEIFDLSPDELAKWQETGKPIWNEWVKQMEAKKLPGQLVLDEIVKLIEKYSK
jgi:TRAP-type C4-dicarboxylate transport system substrate-binding protein